MRICGTNGSNAPNVRESLSSCHLNKQRLINPLEAEVNQFSRLIGQQRGHPPYKISRFHRSKAAIWKHAWYALIYWDTILAEHLRVPSITLPGYVSESSFCTIIWCNSPLLLPTRSTDRAGGPGRLRASRWQCPHTYRGIVNAGNTLRHAMPMRQPHTRESCHRWDHARSLRGEGG